MNKKSSIIGFSSCNVHYFLKKDKSSWIKFVILTAHLLTKLKAHYDCSNNSLVNKLNALFKFFFLQIFHCFVDILINSISVECFCVCKHLHIFWIVAVSNCFIFELLVELYMWIHMDIKRKDCKKVVESWQKPFLEQFDYEI